MAAKKTTSRGVVAAAARVSADLSELGVGHALVGGLAVSARSEPRFTRDVDIAVAVNDDAAAEHVVHALSRRGYVVETVIEHARHGRLATARLTHPEHGETFIDLLFASSGIEPEVVGRAELLSYREAASLPVARTGDLIALKVLSESEVRLQDRLDLAALHHVATDADLALAEAAARQIRARGFHRGRALVTRVRRWRRRARR